MKTIEPRPLDGQAPDDNVPIPKGFFQEHWSIHFVRLKDGPRIVVICEDGMRCKVASHGNWGSMRCKQWVIAIWCGDCCSQFLHQVDAEQNLPRTARIGRCIDEKHLTSGNLLFKQGAMCVEE